MSKLLIVDDDPFSREILAACLAEKDYQIEAAVNGFDALEKTANNPPDLVVLDIVMPEMNGYEVCRHLRVDPLLSDVPIVMLSGMDDEASRLEAFRAGADAFLSKTANRTELKALVQAITHQNRFRNLYNTRTERNRDRITLEHACETILEAQARALEKRGIEPQGHLDRITPLALLLGRAMGFSGESAANLRRGVLLHDIGLNSLAPDSPRSRLEGHPSEAVALFSQIPLLQGAIDVAYCHHEQWDGSGYPRGLKGPEIPLAARLFSVVDAWDALTAAQRESGPLSHTLEHLRDQAGTRLDPAVVDAFITLMESSRDAASPESAPPPVPPPEPAPEPASHQKQPEERNPWRALSLVSRGSRVHFMAALALTSFIPVLALGLALLCQGLFPNLPRGPFIPVGLFVLFLMGLGCSMLAKYPANLMRLRRSLESMSQGVLPDPLDLSRDEDDLAAIEQHMGRIVSLFQDRIRTIQNQTEALLDAERQRVAIEGLGAACHHMGQPASTLMLALHLVRKSKTPEEHDSALDQCQRSIEEIRDILHKLLHQATYRTEPYLSSQPDGKERRILKI